MDYEKDVSIDINHFDLEWLRQADLVLQYGEEHAQARFKLDRAKEAMEVEQAKAQVQLRSVAFAADRHNIPNDQLKYALPEAYKTTLVWSINARSLRNFFILRMSERAHWEIRKLAFEVFGAIPNDHVILYEDVVMPHLEKVAERQLEVY